MRFNAPLPAATGDLVRLNIQYHNVGGAFETSFDYMSNAVTGNPSAVMSLLASAWIVAHGNRWLGLLGTDTFTDGIMVADIGASVAPSVFYPWPAAPAPGTENSASYPSDVACTVTRYANVKGQHGRGRNLFGPVPLTFVDAGAEPNVLNAGSVISYQALTDQVRTTALTAAATTWRWVITTRPVAPAVLVTQAGLIARTLCRPILGTARRRREGRGQ